MVQRRKAVAVVAAWVVMAAPAGVFADQVDPPPETEQLDEAPADPAVDDSVETPEPDHRFELATGLRLGASGVAGYGFENDEYVEDENGNRVPSPADTTWGYPEYYPHGGAGFTGGLSLEARYNGFIGLETGLLYSIDNASGYVDKDHAQTGATIATIHSQQNTSALQLPVLVKANVPAEHVRPFISTGFNFVFQQSSQLDYHQEQTAGRYASDDDMERLNERNQIEPSTYAQLYGTAGVELVVHDVRIPMELRIGYTLGYDRAMDQRARGEDGQIIYDGVYLGHFGVFAGALYEFDLL